MLSVRDYRSQEGAEPSTYKMKAMLGAFVGLNAIIVVLGHGRLIDPASRNSAWRYGFNTPRQDTDNELNCGGFSVQWDTNKGKCGVCGDPYHFKQGEALYTFPGKYANGTITRTYIEGEEIKVLVDVTSNHQGYFTFSLGKIGKPPITQEKLTYVLKQPDSGDTKWKINSTKNRVFEITLELPRGLTCEHCVIQWWWRVANNWGCDGSDCGMGKGQQETFVNCADIMITKSDGSVPPPPPTEAPLPTQMPPKPTTQRPTEPPPTNAPKPNECKAVGPYRGNKAMDVWCVQNCAKGNCPKSLCYCPK